MAGISHCRRLVFETSDGENAVCRVAFDAESINRLTRPGQEPATIADAISSNCSIDELPNETRTRFLEVRLEGVDEPALLDADRLTEYLEQTAPVRQDRTVWRFQEKIVSFARNAGQPQSVDTVAVRVCGVDGSVLCEVFRPFKDSFVTRNANGQQKHRVDVTDVVPLPRSGDYDGWWGWLAVHRRQGALADVPFRGLRLRMHNIAIGDHRVVQALWTTAPHAVWCFGEIHVVDPALVPNSQRDDFEPSEAWTRVQEQIRDEVRQINKEIRRESTERNTSVSTVIKRAEYQRKKVTRRLDAGLTSRNEKERLLDELDKQSRRLERALQERKRSDTEKSNLIVALKSLSTTKEAVMQVERTEADASMAHLSRQARKAVRTVLTVVKDEIDDDELFARIEERIHSALQPGHKES